MNITGQKTTPRGRISLGNGTKQIKLMGITTFKEIAHSVNISLNEQKHFSVKKVLYKTINDGK